MLPGLRCELWLETYQTWPLPSKAPYPWPVQKMLSPPKSHATLWFWYPSGRLLLIQYAVSVPHFTTDVTYRQAPEQV